MANVFLSARESTKVKAPVSSATVIEVGDLLYLDPTGYDVQPASDQADNVGEEDNQAEFARNFAGIALHASASGDTDAILVETSLTKEYSFTVPSGTYRLGDLLGASEASGTQLADQVLEAVSSKDLAIAIVTDDDSAARTSVKCRFVRSVFAPTFNDRYGATRTTATGNITLTFDSKTIQSIDPGGAGRTITLPADEEATGLIFFLINRADMAEALTVQDDGSNTIVTVAQNEMGYVVHDGTAWFGGTWTQT